jgi:selenocysteine lyase/cysteine desulfurase
LTPQQYPSEADMAVPAEALIPAQREAFNVPEEIAYFNTASLAPQLRAVREAGEAALASRGQPWLISASDWFTDVERLRSLFAQLIGASADGVAIVPATSYGFAVAARTLPLKAGQRVLVLAEEYPSGIYTWRAASRRASAELLTVDREPGSSWTDAVLAALDERVAIVSVPNVHWTDGALLDLAAIAERTHELDAALVIDASQSVGAMPTDVGSIRPDFMVTVGYKWLLGPFSVGYLYVGERHREGEPLEENWINRTGSEDFAALVEYRDGYQPGARRFDSGQRTKFELVPMAIAALEQILAWQVPSIAATLKSITGRLAQRASALGLEVAPDHTRGPHMLGLRLPEPARARASAVLTQANCYAAFRGASLRISPHLHTTDQDVERLLNALARAADATTSPHP